MPEMKKKKTPRSTDKSVWSTPVLWNYKNGALVSRHILKGAENEAVYLTQGAVTSDVMRLFYS